MLKICEVQEFKFRAEWRKYFFLKKLHIRGGDFYPCCNNFHTASLWKGLQLFTASPWRQRKKKKAILHSSESVTHSVVLTSSLLLFSNLPLTTNHVVVFIHFSPLWKLITPPFTLTLIIKQIKILMNMGGKNGQMCEMKQGGGRCVFHWLCHTLKWEDDSLNYLDCVCASWQNENSWRVVMGVIFLFHSTHPLFTALHSTKAKGNKLLPSTAFSIWKPYFVRFLSLSLSLSPTNCSLISSVCALCLDTPLSSFSHCLSVSSLSVLLPFQFSLM